VEKKMMRDEEKKGITYTVCAYLFWGFLPLYWKLLQDVPVEEVLAQRIFWSLIFMILIILIFKKWSDFHKDLKSMLTNKKLMVLLVTAGLLISTNWFIYIWAVNNNHVIETSLGYYINPLVTVLMGMIVFKEKLNGLQLIALLLAFIAVLILTVQYGEIPWIALSLAFSFALYGLVKKSADYDAVLGLTFETLVVFPFATAFLLRSFFLRESAIYAGSIETTFLIVGAGVMTAVPLLLFAHGAIRIPMYVIGFLQYIAPTIMLFLAIFVFNESFTSIHFVSFTLIWVSLVIFTWSKTKNYSRLHARKPKSFSA
jgi:chloramphenicol-sensitive protein RarD